MKIFSDALNTAVFTTRFVISENSPILFVYHFEDGYWQFSGPEDEVKNEDIKLVALSEIIKIDPTILEISDLPYSWEATRSHIGSSWIKRKFDDEIED
jgi:hypothetical protein